MTNILVTGGAGFIGSHIVDALVSKGYSVVVIDNLISGKKENVNPSARLVVKDIREDLDDLFYNEKFDYVYHLAAQMNVRKSLENPKEDAEINIIGGLNVISNCVKHKVKKIIFSSTGGALYSSTAEIPCNEEMEIVPESPYGLAKFATEHYMRIMKNVYGLDYCCLRYANVYGPRQNSKGEAGVIAIFIDNLLAGRDLIVNGDGEQTRDYVYVKDVVKANMLALEKNLHGSYNVGTGKETSVNELAENIIELVGMNGNVVHGEAVVGELRRNALDASKLMKEGWNADYDLNSGLKETVEWFKAKV